MKLISCDGCGTVIDQDKLNFPAEDYLKDSDGTFDLDRCAWNGSKYVPMVKCRVCSGLILKES